MKAEKEHRVPLSQEAITLLESIQDHTQAQDFIFPAPRTGEMLSDMSLTTLIKRMHEQKFKENGIGYIDPKQNRIITTHGFVLHFVTGQPIKQITLVKSVSMF
jgi:integrase